MTPPRICPPPPDCPLYDQRLPYTEDEPLRRAILMERRNRADLPALIRAEAAVKAQPPQAALPPAPEPFPLPVLAHLKKEGTP